MDLSSFSPPRSRIIFGSPNEDTYPLDFKSTSGKRIKILLLENISKAAIQKLKNEEYEVECFDGSLEGEELLTKIRDVHAIGVRSRTELSQEVLRYAQKLLCVGCFCIGTDKVDLKAACNKGIPVFNSPYQNSRSVAELIIAMVISLSRKLGDQNINMHTKKWNKSSSHCHEVRGKTLGIVGYGHIGSQLSVLAESLGMRVIFYDVVSQMPLGNSKSTPDLESLLRKSDFVTLHVPQTPETKNLITSKEIYQMKKGSYLLNASRGNVVAIPDLIEALKTKHLNGAFLDVYPEEPKDNTDSCSLFEELASCPNTILTPHIGGSTVEAQDAIGEEVSWRIIQFLKTGNTFGSVNFPQVDLPYGGIGTHRILNIHENKPGILKEINHILSIYNVESQTLRTHGSIGYFVADVDRGASNEIKQKIREMKHSIKTRIVY